MTVLRLRIAAPDVRDGRLVVEGGEHRYLARVRRARPGETVEIVDGAGVRLHGTIARVGPSSTEIAGLTPLAAPELLPLTLGLGLGRAEPLARIVRAATELGATTIVPLRCARDLGRREPARRGIAERWRRVAAEALRTSGRARVPEIPSPTSLDAWSAASSPAGACLVLDAEGEPLADAVRSAVARGAGSWTLAVGPEGGWTAEEVVRLVAHGFVRAALGPLNLRVETAAIGALAVLRTLVSSR